MGLFGGIAKARALNSGGYMRPGHYLARIDNVKLAKSRKQGDYVAVEMTCLHAFPDGEPPKNGAQWHRPGEQMSEVMSASNDMFLGKVKAFIANAMRVSADQINEAEAEVVTGSDQPLKGMVVEVIGRTIVTKGKKIEITQVSYVGPVPAERLPEILDSAVIESQFPGDSLEQLAARQAELLG